ncbi:MAG: 5'/3'-nucleotidase SurE [Candidatus Aenigmarchaeota archaeon]|nr:5'/3'-nucleotidase SurE [Candidatus Aenigmarchaeota archaeon]
MRKILLTNDDGIGSKGLRALEEAVKGLGKIYVVAPKGLQSSTSRALTKRKFLEVEEMENYDGIERYAIDGTPATCVLIAIEKVLKEKPDLIISGINLGENLGTTTYTTSGTIGAALEAATTYGIPAIAASVIIPIEHHEIHEDYPVDLTIAKNYLRKISKYILESPNNGREYDVLNINFPLSSEDKGFRITAPSKNKFYHPDLIEKDGKYKISHSIKVEDEEENSDVKAVFDGKVSITPLSFISNNGISIEKIEKIFNDVIKW